MPDQWYYRSHGAETGPLSTREMREAVASRLVTPEVEVRHGPAGHWRAASTVHGLLDSQDSAVVLPRPVIWRLALIYLQMLLIAVSLLLMLVGLFVDSETASLCYAAGCGLAALSYFIRTFMIYWDYRKTKAVPPQP